MLAKTVIYMGDMMILLYLMFLEININIIFLIKSFDLNSQISNSLGFRNKYENKGLDDINLLIFMVLNYLPNNDLI